MTEVDLALSTRDRFIQTTCDLLEAQGFHATGLKQIVIESGGPKGSLYYYFPDGKEELAAEAVQHTANQVAARIEAALAEDEPPEAAIPAFVARIADGVEASGFRSGGPVTIVAMETVTSSERINLACRSAYERFRKAFAARLAQSGLPAEQADGLAEFIVAAIEGGIILSRTAHSGDPLRRVAQQLARLLRSELVKPAQGG